MKQRLIGFVMLFLFAFTANVHAQQYVWANHFGGKGTSSITRLSPGTNINTGIAVDGQDNVYAVGWFNDSVDFDPGPNTHFLVGDNEDGYVAKFNHQGQLQWVFSLGSALKDKVADVVVDGQGNVYILGQGDNQVDFDPSTNTMLLDAEHGGANFLFLAKYNANAELQWARSMSASRHAVFGYAMAIDENDDVVITGSMYGQLDFGNSTQDYWVGGNQQGAFFAKYSGAGQLVWAKAIENLGQYGGGSDIAVSAAGNIVVTGFFGGAVDFDLGTTDSIVQAGTTADRFLAKYNSQGDFLWVHNINTNNNGGFSVGRAVQVAITQDEDVILTGDFSGDVDFNSGSSPFILSSINTYSTYLARYGANGRFHWAKPIYGGYCVPSDVALDCEENIFITGCFRYADFDTGFDYDHILSDAPSAANNYLAKYSPQGDYFWAKQMGNNGYGSGIILSTMTVKDNFQYVGGGFKQTADFNPDSTENKRQATGVGHNTFVAKYKTENANQYDTSMCVGSSLALDVSGWGDAFEWQDGSTASVYLVSQPGVYQVKVKDGNCTRLETIHVKKKDCPATLDMPNVFTPNHDGVNDFFRPSSMQGVINWKITIVSRWGGVVYEAQNETAGWDGTFKNRDCSSGVYFWIVEYTNSTNTNSQIKGQVTLLR